MSDAAILDADRLAAVLATGLLDTGAEEAFDRLTGLASVVLETPYAFVTLVDDKRSFWKSCFGVDSDDPADRQNLVQESFCQYVVASGEPLIVGDVTTNAITMSNPSITSMGVRAWAGFPITDTAGEVLGTFCVVDTKIREWSDHHVETLRTLSHATSGEIRLRVSTNAALSFARNLQASLIPEELPEIPGLDIAALHLPAMGLGGVLGDFYDVFKSSLHNWHLAIGDVCGHGIEAAKTTSVARWAIRTSANHNSDPAAILSDVHDVLYARGGELFITALAGTVDVRDRETHIALGLAGHPPALLRRADGTVETIGPGGQILGMIPNPTIGSTTVVLHPGDVLILHTDGLTEARRNGVLLGTERARQLLETIHPKSAADVVESLHAYALSWSTESLSDDLAILVAMAPTP